MTDINQIDYRTIAQSRITQQYGDKPKFVELVRELAGLVEDDLETPAANLFDILDIDLMEGANLDNIGNIVGQSRVLIDYDLLEFFGYDGATAAGTYGDSNDSAIGERYLSYFEESGGTKELADPEYRLFIKARILKNYSDGTRDDIVESIKILFDAEQVKIDEGVMTLDIGILGNLSDNDLALVQEYDILPRPTGVGITSVYNYGLLEFNGASTSVNISSAISDIDGATTGSISGQFLSRSKDGGLVRMAEDAGGHLHIYIDDYRVKFSLQEGATTIVEFETNEQFIGDFYKFELIFSPSGNGMKINSRDAELTYSTGSESTPVYISTNYLNAFIGIAVSWLDGIMYGVKFDNSGTITAQYDLTEGTGTTATDTSGNGNDGTITDGTWVTTLS